MEKPNKSYFASSPLCVKPSPAGISVLMPTYRQGAFINCAIRSLLQQSFTNWELIIINDGSDDNTLEIIQHFFTDKRIRYYENQKNTGLGAALNKGIDLANFDYIAYLPSDDIYFEEHLETLFEKINSDDNSVLAFSGIKHHNNYNESSNKSRASEGQILNNWLQLVQVLHKKCSIRWIERKELVTDDLHRMFWQNLTFTGLFLPTHEVTCEWIDHPKQRHKLINRIYSGGISAYRQFYKVKEILKFCSTSGDSIDETEYNQTLQVKPKTTKKRLKILLAGELSYNPERICALEENGCELYGLWIKDTKIQYMTGPLPFGSVIDLPYENWENAIKEIKPDIIYAQQSSLSINLVHKLLQKTNIPLVWHLKESQHISRDNGLWEKLLDIYLRADGLIYIHPFVKDWMEQYLPPNKDKPIHYLDGDLPKNNWFTNERSQLLSDKDGEPHTVLLGRPVGLSPEDIMNIASQKIHFHIYGNYKNSTWKSWFEKAKELAGNYFHIHANISPNNWVREFSKYDAGWLHHFKSENKGDVSKVDWHDMNYPARITTLAAASVPFIQYDNKENLVATYDLAKKLDIGIFFKTTEELAEKLQNKDRMKQLRENVWKQRMYFTFDFHVSELIAFFEKVINTITK